MLHGQPVDLNIINQQSDHLKYALTCFDALSDVSLGAGSPLTGNFEAGFHLDDLSDDVPEPQEASDRQAGQEESFWEDSDGAGSDTSDKAYESFAQEPPRPDRGTDMPKACACCFAVIKSLVHLGDLLLRTTRMTGGRTLCWRL